MLLHEEVAMPSKVHDEPSNVSAEDGVVMVDGPDGVAVAMTPRAASETSDRLLEGSAEAQGQIMQRQAAQPQKDPPSSGEDQ